MISSAQENNIGTVKITFVNTVNDTPLVLNDKAYTNAWGEEYTVSQLKYYISNVGLYSGNDTVYEKNGYHLIDESKEDSKSFSFAVKPGLYQNLSFLIGVDSLMNVSGAQSGALDPLNGMFWTWNSGYIMFKLEGTSPQSTAVNNKIEYHIGGYSGADNVLRKMCDFVIPLDKKIDVKKGKTTEILVSASLNMFWQSLYCFICNTKISEHPVCTTPGHLAKLISYAYVGMFSIKDVINNK